MAAGKVTVTITADKEGLIAHLEEQRTYAAEQAVAVGVSRRHRDHYAGRRDGIDFAIRTLRNWTEAKR